MILKAWMVQMKTLEIVELKALKRLPGRTSMLMIAHRPFLTNLQRTE